MGKSVGGVMFGVHKGSEADDEQKLLGLFAGIMLPKGGPTDSTIKDLVNLTTTTVPIPMSEFDGEGGALFVNASASLNGGGGSDGNSPVDTTPKETKKASKEAQTEKRYVRISKLRSNQLQGTLDLLSLPTMLVNLDLAKMKLTGHLDLTALPHTLQYLNLSNNGFNGPISLATLPAQLSEVHLEENRFSGILDLSKLPMSMEALYVHGNLFDWLGVTLEDGQEAEAELGPGSKTAGASPPKSTGAKMVESHPAVDPDPTTPPRRNLMDPYDPNSPSGRAPNIPSTTTALHRIPIKSFNFAHLPFKLKLLNITNNRFKNKFDTKGVRATCTIFD